MALKDKIMQDMKQAMRDKNKIALSALRAVKSAILLYETDGENKELDQAAEMKLLQKQVKQRKDSAQVYKEQNRPDLAENELAEAEVIEKYLPKALTEEEVEAEVRKVIEETGASGMKDMGKVMGLANKKLAGKADGKMIADKAKALLSE
ncbi:MAG TPA: GatB/YqeY domain-containing protein [Bacteroidales bacterium]|nr:GatB/YqeY domain-containing protein [Bacteroidales bacterium]